ncbi:MAG TPA: amino acid permease, partial [Candidatus Tenderia sp.]|nr:amino acid permease [Candidatus Tenderia sp.]
MGRQNGKEWLARMSAVANQRTDKLDLKQVIAMGVGAMVGGGIFSVLGLAIVQAGHAAPIAFALGGVIALLTGWSYARLGLVFRSDGGSFTYLEKAFGRGNIAGIGGWLLLVGYIGTMGLYAYTFGVYGSALLGGGTDEHQAMHHLLASLVLLAFLGVNLYGVKETGTAELLIVTIKVLILFLFAAIGLYFVKTDYVLPVFNNGHLGVLMGAALIFVAYEGFELIPNAVNEMENPERNLTRGILWSIGITIAIYVLVSLVAVGNLLPEEIARYQEYALAVAAKPFLGEAGFMLIGLAALFSTASAINATLFGTARLGAEMARAKQLPASFGFRRRQNNIPWVSLVVITAVTL